MIVIAEGYDLISLKNVDSYVMPGSLVELRLYVDNTIIDINSIQQNLESNGVELDKPVKMDKQIMIMNVAQSGQTFATIADSIGTEITGWQLVEDSKNTGVPMWVWGVTAGLFLIHILRRSKKWHTS